MHYGTIQWQHHRCHRSHGRARYHSGYRIVCGGNFGHGYGVDNLHHPHFQPFKLLSRQQTLYYHFGDIGGPIMTHNTSYS